MKNKITFGSFEAICITITLITTQLFLNLPRSMMEAAWTAGWLLTVYITVLALILFLVIERLYRPFEGKDLLDLGEYIAGNTGRIIVGLIFIFFFLYINPVILREFCENIKIIALPESPLSFVMLFFITCMIIAAYAGLESIVRFSAIIVPLIAGGYIIIITGALRYCDVSRITPWLGNGPYEIFIKGMPRISVFVGIILVYFLYPFIRKKSLFKTVGYRSIILSGIFFFTGVLVFALVYQYPTGTENFLPIYQLSRLVDYGRFFQRVESMFVIIWVASALLHLSINLFLIPYVFKKTFKLKYYKPLILPFAIIVYALAFFPENLTSTIELEKHFRNFAWLVTFLLPIILLSIAGFVKPVEKKGAGKSE